MLAQRARSPSIDMSPPRSTANSVLFAPESAPGKFAGGMIAATCVGGPFDAAAGGGKTCADGGGLVLMALGAGGGRVPSRPGPRGRRRGGGSARSNPLAAGGGAPSTRDRVP